MNVLAFVSALNFLIFFLNDLNSFRFTTVKDFDSELGFLTSHIAPIYPRNAQTVIESRKNVDFTVNYWLYKGLQKEKLILGITLYADTYKFDSKTERAKKRLNYHETCQLIEMNHWNFTTSKEQMVSYFFNETNWIGSENIESIQLKAMYAIENQLGGLAFWVRVTKI